MKKLIFATSFMGIVAALSFAHTPSCIPFENGKGDYDKNCYNSGLLNMEEGACYVINPKRKSEGLSKWINNIATEKYWWVKISCDGTEPPKTKCVDFEQGLGNYDKTCIKFGLLNMKEGVCYTMNPKRGQSPENINNIATETWWWVETSCDDNSVTSSSSEIIEESSSSVVVVEESSSSEIIEESSSSVVVFEESSSSEIIEESSSSVVVVEESSSSEIIEESSSSVVVVEESSSSEIIEESSSSVVVFEESSSSEIIEESSSSVVVVEESSSSEIIEESSSSVVVADTKCIEFVKDVNNYVDNCFNAGLKNMKEGVCYALNPKHLKNLLNGNPKINDNANSDWWIEVSCESDETESSSSVIVEESSSSEVIEESSSSITVEESSSSEIVEESSSSEEEIDPSFNFNQYKCIALMNGKSKKCYNHIFNRKSTESCFVIDLSHKFFPHWAKYIPAHSIFWKESSCDEYRISRAPEFLEPPTDVKMSYNEKIESKFNMVVNGKALNVTSTSPSVKIVKVFDVLGNVLKSESFTSSKSIDMSNLALKGPMIVRVTEGNKVIYSKRVIIR